VANHISGAIRRLVYAAPETVTNLPLSLAETGIFSDLKAMRLQSEFIPYSLNVPFWSDHAIKRRWFSLPSGEGQIGFDPTGNWQFPSGTVWVKHFDMPLTNGLPESSRRLETRVLMKTSNGVYGLTYRWGRSLTNAYLVPDE
jgi:hypothetical protein